MGKRKILLLEDNEALHDTIREVLEDDGFEVTSLYDGKSAQDSLYESSFDLLLLDVNVPHLSGFELLKEARERGVNTPALFITSRDTMVDVEEGFSSGADDYIRKPFAIKELLLRINSILLRRFMHPSSKRVEITKDLSFDMQQDILYRGDEQINISIKTKSLLKLLLERRGEIVTHEVILDRLWDYDETSSDDALRTYIKELRKVIGKEQIQSHKRLGYQLR